MNSIDRIHMNKVLNSLELRVKQAKGPDHALLVRLIEVRSTLVNIKNLYSDDPIVGENLELLDTLIKTMKKN